MFVTGILFLVTIAFTEAQETTTPAAEDAVTISIDDQLLTFTGQYCTGADPALGNVFRTALRCIESESLPGMSQVARECWKEVMDTSYPRQLSEWKRFVCEDSEFMEKKAKITECFQKKVSPQEEALYFTNISRCMSGN